MVHNQFSYWVKIMTPSNKTALALLEELQQMRVVPDFLVGQIDEANPCHLYLQVDEDSGTIDEWDGFGDAFLKVAANHPDVTIEAEGICEESYSLPIRMIFSSGKLAEAKVGCILPPDEAAEYLAAKKAGKATPFIYRIEEENVDGCGSNAYIYAAFDHQLGNTQLAQLKKVLQETKENDDDLWGDTEELIGLSLAKFHEQTGIAGTICNSPLTDIITF